MEVGLVIMDENPADALRIARAADEAGVHSLWSIDYYNRSSLTRAAAFAAVSGNAVVGTSVTPLFARSPLALASAGADIQAIAGGRFVLGVGSSTRRMNQDWYGTALQHPAPQVRDRIELVRSLIAHRSATDLRITTQIVAAADSDRAAARRDAAAQVGFYATPKGYDALFPGGHHDAERRASREALARNDIDRVVAAGQAMVRHRAVYGTPEDIVDQLRRYADVVD